MRNLETADAPRSGAAAAPARAAADGATGASDALHGAATTAPDALVLFDIDGTLLTAGAAPRRALAEAMTAVWGTPGPVTDHDFSGKTDPQIVRELLARVGLPEEVVERGLDRALDLYVDRLLVHLRNDPEAALLAGVSELVPALAREPRAALALLTGNVLAGARVKLGRFGIWTHFATGAFGSDDAERNQLPAVAVERARTRWGVPFPPERVFVVGDTPLDIAAGRAIGAVTVAVDTGRTRGQLSAHGPDHLLPDLGEWRTTLWPILFGSPAGPGARASAGAGAAVAATGPAPVPPR